MRGLVRWSSKWWPGTIPLAVIWALAAWTSTAPLETELAGRSTAALKDIVLDKSRITVSGRDVALAADAFSEDGRRNAVAAIEAVPGVRLVNDETRLIPEAKPFVWSAERDVVRVTLTGSSPLPASKGKLLEAARADLGGVEVVDQTNLSRGAPPRFDDAALLLLDQVAQTERRQDHHFGYQGQPVRHGARPRRPRGDCGCAEKSARGFFGRLERDQGAALYFPGQQGPGGGRR